MCCSSALVSYFTGSSFTDESRIENLEAEGASEWRRGLCGMGGSLFKIVEAHCSPPPGKPKPKEIFTGHL